MSDFVWHPVPMQPPLIHVQAIPCPKCYGLAMMQHARYTGTVGRSEWVSVECFGCGNKTFVKKDDLSELKGADRDA